jgi:[acyl-carrier-protein] S-malonyltransferase
VKPEGAAGFSLGEYAALYEAGVIRLEDLFPIVQARGNLMEKASRNLDSATGNPGMAAVIGLDYDGVKKALSGLEGVYLANYNSPTQIVVSGTFDGLERAEPVFEEAGARRFIPLKVSGPFHSPLLEEARAGLEEELAKYEFSDPTIPVFANVTGQRIESGTQAKELCVKQVVSSVRWVDEINSILSAGFDRFVEAGPGTVLAGLLKKISKETLCLPAGKLEEIEKVVGG